MVCQSNEPWSSERDPNGPLVALATRRRPPPILVVDHEFRIIAQSSGLDIAELAPYVRRLVERHVQERSAPHMTVEVLDTTTALRVVDLNGPENRYFAITFERTEQRRDAAEAIAAEHHLTKREREVFRMLLNGSSDEDVSQQLFISKRTASDHAKNILRKTGTSRRTKLFAKVIKYEDRRASDS